MVDDYLSFAERVAYILGTWCFTLYNIQRDRPYRIQYAAQILLQALVICKLEYCNGILASLPAWTVKIKNMVVCPVFDKLKRSLVTLMITHHWLSVAVWLIQMSDSCPQDRQWIRTYLFLFFHSDLFPCRILCSSDEQHLLSAARDLNQDFLFLFLGPKWWNKRPIFSWCIVYANLFVICH